MFRPQEYQLLAFGRGRKLEQFGPWRLDRPSPQAAGLEGCSAAAALAAHGVYEPQGRDGWQWNTDPPDVWQVRHGSLVFELKATPTGQVGLFPEQAENWDWLAEQVRRWQANASTSEPTAPARPQVLNLFGYTGGSTLAVAAAGAAAVHLDAAANVVAWARRNAQHSGLAEAPIRWIADDARKFVGRELRRGRRYDGVVLDPPTYGHGAGGEAWRLARDLPELLSDCRRLVPDGGFLLLTCHTPEFPAERLARMASEAGFDDRRLTGGELAIATADGRRLPSGVCVRIAGG